MQLHSYFQRNAFLRKGSALHCRAQIKSVVKVHFTVNSAANDTALLDSANDSSTKAFVLDLPLPEQKYQQRIPLKEVKEHRSIAENMAKHKRLLKVQVGQQGITQNFLNSCMDILMKHNYIRIKLGEGCEMDRKEAARVLSEYLDSICVHQIGFTITLYRENHPRPSNCILPLIDNTAETPSPEVTKQSSKNINSRVQSAIVSPPAPEFQVV